MKENKEKFFILKIDLKNNTKLFNGWSEAGTWIFA